jgi:hypothetical protein
MSEDTDGKPQPPAVAMKASLERLEALLGGMAQQQAQQQDLGLLLADCRDTITEAVGVMHSQGSDILRQVGLLTQQLARPAPPRWPTWWGLVAVGVVVLGLAVGVWRLWPETRYNGLALALDGVLVQHYTTFARPVQEQITTVYARHGVLGPGQRQKGGNGR